MKLEAVVFVDVDDNFNARYTYREPHFVAARNMGLACIIIAVKGRKNIERLQTDCDVLLWVNEVSETTLIDEIIQISNRYDIKALFCHAGHASREGQIGCIVADVCEKLGLTYSPSSSIEICNNKFLMRQVLESSGVRSINYALCSNEAQLHSEAQRLGYPLIAKPPFGAASGFIKRCLTWKELQEHYLFFVHHHQESAFIDFYGRQHEFTGLDGCIYSYQPGITLLLEEYIEGLEGCVELVIDEQTVYPVLIHEKLMLTEKSGTILENLLISPPENFSKQQVKSILDYSRCCVEAIGLRHAIAHLEFRLSVNGPVVIEINPRLGGLYVDAAFRDLVKLDPYFLYLNLLMGRNPSLTELDDVQHRITESRQSYAMMAFYPDKSGLFEGFINLELLDGFSDIIEYNSLDTGRILDAEIEEHYLLKVWSIVNDADQARDLYTKLVNDLQPIILDTIDIVKKKTIAKYSQQLNRQDYCHIPQFSELIHYSEECSNNFKSYWEQLVLDNNFKNYTHRERRILRYIFHYGSPLQINRDNNYCSPITYDINYVGGVNKLSYSEEGFIDNSLLQQIISTDIEILGKRLNSKSGYAIDIHQFRVCSKKGEKSSPTTSGKHQDGVDWIFMHFIDKDNLEPVTSEIYLTNSSPSPIFKNAMTGFLETLVINDSRLFHEASAVKSIDKNMDSYRDLLLVTFRKL